MNNRNLGILIAVVIIAAAAICFTIMKANKDETKAIQNAALESTSQVEPAAETPVPAEPTADNPVVGTVDGVNILRSEVVAFMRNFPPQMQQMPVEQLFPIALEQVVTAKVVDARAAKVSELQSDAEVMKRLAEAKIQIVRTVYLEKEIEKLLTPERTQKAYDKFKAEQGKIEEVHARHILVEKEETAKEIVTKLEGGAKFEDLAKEYSKDPSNKDTGGDLGYFTKETMVKEFADAAFGGKKGEVLKTPVKTQFGFHVIEILDKRNRPVPTFEEVKPALEAEERRQILNEMVEGWVKDAKVTKLNIEGKPIEKKAEEAPKK
ncbi:MAG: hypothetical protein DI586_05690 [Micavibrio aeruginosavorus]|uniref:PpiC domain-containing protein n=1 Tax=Micavibrio aeruginosavorus TaxID=349221 RepID=A0A2W5FLD5_9BACT|nr:MAG: hypothetical protein DI586_05690 [Micavibrio aeruginosavorus]